MFRVEDGASGPREPLCSGEIRPERVWCGPYGPLEQNAIPVTYQNRAHLFGNASLGYRKVRALEHQNRGTAQSPSSTYGVGLP